MPVRVDTLTVERILVLPDRAEKVRKGAFSVLPDRVEYTVVLVHNVDTDATVVRTVLPIRLEKYIVDTFAIGTSSVLLTYDGTNKAVRVRVLPARVEKESDRSDREETVRVDVNSELPTAVE